MQTFPAWLLLLSLLINPKSVSVLPEKKPLTIAVQQLKNTTAGIYVAVYKNTQDFGKTDKIYRGAKIVPNGKTRATVDIPDLEYGIYAIAVYQDINGNGKLDTGLFGIPKEPYGFSNNFKPVFSGPTFEKCRFTYSEQNALVTINILQ